MELRVTWGHQETEAGSQWKVGQPEMHSPVWDSPRMWPSQLTPTLLTSDA